MAEWNCFKCKNEDDIALCARCEDGSEYITKTNADRIRSMTDEELAEFLADQVLNALHFYCGTETFEKIDFRKSVEIDMRTDWLKSEV